MVEFTGGDIVEKMKYENLVEYNASHHYPFVFTDIAIGIGKFLLATGV